MKIELLATKNADSKKYEQDTTVNTAIENDMT
jgi:hypothetical protein